jgi:polysaccharide biosynthesis transport protein
VRPDELSLDGGRVRSQNEESAWGTVAAYVGVLRRRAWIVVLVAVGVPAIAVAYSLTQPDVYEASSKVLVSRENLAATLSGVADTAPSADPKRFIETQRRLARTGGVAARTVQAAGSSTTAGEFLRSSNATSALDSDVLTLSAQSRRAAEAVALANAYAKTFVSYRNDLDTAPIRRALASVQTRIRALRRAGETTTPLANSLRDKQQQLQTIQALKTNSVTVVEPAREAAKIAPQTRKAGELALIFGLFLGVGLAFVREGLAGRLRSPDEIAERLELPILGRIPQSEHNDPLPPLTNPASRHADAYRMLRMNLQFASASREVRTLMVTSATAGDGKSTTAANLGITMAQAGRDVVLIDADFLRPSLADVFSLPSGPGLIDVLKQKATLDGALVHVLRALTQATTPLPTVRRTAAGRQRDRVIGYTGNRGQLRVLTTKTAPIEWSETLVEEEFRRVLAEAESGVDLVIVDAPPLGTSVTLWLGSLVDSVLVVANTRSMREPTLDELAQFLDELPAEKLGLVLTHVASAGRRKVYADSPTELAEPAEAPVAARSRRGS